MVQTIQFNNWFYQHVSLGRFLLMLVLFAAVAQFASFALIQGHVVSFYGAQGEDIAFALQIAYAGIITTLPIQFRMIKYFSPRSYLLTAFLIGIILNVGCIGIHDLALFAIIRFFIGSITCMVGGGVLMSIFSTLPEAKRVIIGLALFFSLILACSVLVGIGTSWIVLTRNWTAVFYGLIGLQMMAIVLCLVIFKSAPPTKPYPLYQIDWFGCVLLVSGASAAAFAMIYGPKYDWFSDPEVRYASIFAIVVIVLFLVRQTVLKRPLVDLNAFRNGKFVFAILLMLLFWGIKDSINLLYGYSAAVLGWSSADIVNSGLYNVAGVILATVIAVKAVLVKKKNLPKLLLAGFAIMALYHLWVCLHITPDLSFADLCIPIFFHGFACGLLFVPVTVFCMAALPPNLAITGIIICAYARFIASLNSFAGFYSLQLKYNQLFKEGFLSKLISGSEALLQRQESYKNLMVLKGFTAGEASRISNMFIAKSSAIQSQLLTMRAIFLLAAIIMAVVFIGLVLFAVISRIKAPEKVR